MKTTLGLALLLLTDTHSNDGSGSDGGPQEGGTPDA
jgi:hypothetical protein